MMSKHNRTIRSLLCFVVLIFISNTTNADDVVSDKNIGMELARDIVTEAILACRKDDYHVGVVVVDRHGLVRAALRDDLASRFTLDIAERKANLTVMAWVDSGAFRKARSDIRPELNNIDGLIVMDGGIKIVAGGYNLGAVGVSGAPGGEKDAACAKAAIKKLSDRMEFAID